MKVSFRQGLVRAPSGFLVLSGSNVNLVIPSADSVIVNFADGSSNYLLTERATINSAWTGVTPAVDQWLYWDVDVTTGAKTFGITLVQPSHGGAAPSAPVNDKHWFDTQTNTMKVWNSTASRWVRRIRVFAAKLTGGGSFTSMGANTPAFTGTQAGLTGSYTAGAIVFDADGGKPLKRTNGTFFTTEDQAFTHIASASQVKFGSLVIPASADENINAYAVVRFTDYNKVVIATAYTVGTGAYGIVESSLTTGESGNVVVEGVVTNPTWDFTIAGAGLGDEVRFPQPLPVNSPLYIDTLGNLTSIRPVVPVVVAAVVDKSTILIRPSSLSTIFSESTVDPATTTNLGMVTLSVPSATPLSPIVVGDNDPRLTPALDDLTDVSAAAPDSGDVLSFNGTAWVNTALVLDDLTDVDAATPANGNVLTYNETTAMWEPQAGGGGATALADLTDVSLTLSTNGPIAQMTISSPGSGYTDGFYDNIPLLDGSGSGAIISSVQVSGGAVVAFTLLYSGADYAINDILTVSGAALGGTGNGLELTVTQVNPQSENALLRWDYSTEKWVNQDGIPHKIPMFFSILAPLPTAGDTMTTASGDPELVLAEYIAPVDMILYRYTPGSQFIINCSAFGTGSDKYIPLVFNLYMKDPVAFGSFENESTFNQVGEIVRSRSGTANIDHTFCNFFDPYDLVIQKGSTLRLTLDPVRSEFIELSDTGNNGHPDFITGAITLVAVTKKIQPPQQITPITPIVNTNLGGGLSGGSGSYQWSITSETPSTFSISMEYFITNWNALLSANQFGRLYELTFDIQGEGGDPPINDFLATLNLNNGSPTYNGVTADYSEKENNYYIWQHGCTFTYDGTALTGAALGVHTVTFKIYDQSTYSTLLGTCSFEVEVFPAA